jgi:hypothetical protein
VYKANKTSLELLK